MQLQRFLKRNRKDRKIRKRKVKSDATAAVNESQSSEKLEPNGTGSWNTVQSCGKFLSFSGTPAEKKAMREEDQNGRALDGDSLQRELLREVLNDTDLTGTMKLLEVFRLIVMISIFSLPSHVISSNLTNRFCRWFTNLLNNRINESLTLID